MRYQAFLFESPQRFQIVGQCLGAVAFDRQRFERFARPDLGALQCRRVGILAREFHLEMASVNSLPNHPDCHLVRFISQDDPDAARTLAKALWKHAYLSGDLLIEAMDLELGSSVATHNNPPFREGSGTRGPLLMTRRKADGVITGVVRLGCNCEIAIPAVMLSFRDIVAQWRHAYTGHNTRRTAG